MPRILILSTLLALASGLAACDSGTPSSLSDAERIVGSWQGTDLNARIIGGFSVSIPGTDPSVASVTFASGNAFSFLFDPADGSMLGIPQTTISVPLPDQVSITGTYTLDELEEAVSVVRPSIPAALDLGYKFRGDDDLELIAETPDAFAELLGLASADAALIATVVTGGSIRFDRQ